MKYNPDKHHRHSIRLKGYDYSQPGGYYVTIVTQNRECLFGDVVDGKMALNEAGQMIKKWYLELENKFTDILCDAYVVMPNHFHSIIINVGADLRVCPNDADLRVCPNDADLRVCPNDADLRGENEMGEHVGGEHVGSPLRQIVQWFKTMTTNEYIRGVKQNKWPPFNKKLWQRNYWEHIIRDENDFNRIREYIVNNPLQWQMDDENPNRIIAGAGSKHAHAEFENIK